MFPINFNFPYRKKDGSVITMEKALDGAGADLDLVDLDDVAITNPAEGDGLIYDNTAQKWKNIPIIPRILTLFNAWKKNGAYNILLNNRTTDTISGNLFTVNSDKSITVTIPENPTTTNFYLLGSDASVKMTLPAGTYKLVGCPSGGDSSKYYIQGFGNHDYTSGAGILDTGSGVIFTLTQENEVSFFISIRDTFTSGGTFTFKPMISTDLNVTYDDYVPGAKTNRELTEHVAITTGTTGLITLVTSGNNIETNATVVEKYGKLCIVNIAVKFSADTSDYIKIGTVANLPRYQEKGLLTSAGVVGVALIETNGDVKIYSPRLGWTYAQISYIAQ